MSPSAQGDPRSLPLESKHIPYLNAEQIPEEYHQLLMPNAGAHYWQQANVHILSQHILLEKFSLWVHDILSDNDHVLQLFVPFPLYSLHYLFESNLSIRMPKWTSLLLEEDTCNLFYLKQGVSYLPLEAGTKSLSVHINIRPQYMPELTKHYPAIYQRLPETPSGNQVINSRPYAINAIGHLLITRMLTCRYPPQDAALYLERCCSDLFTIFCRQYAIEDRSPFTQDVDAHDIYHKIFEYLKANTHIYHDIHKISWMFEIPEGELTTGFLNTFALTIHECIHMLKMMQAFDMLMQHMYDFGAIAAAIAMDTEKMISAIHEYYGYRISVQRD